MALAVKEAGKAGKSGSRQRSTGSRAPRPGQTGLSDAGRPEKALPGTRSPVPAALLYGARHQPAIREY